MDLKQWVLRQWIGLIWLRIGSNKPTGSGIGWLGEGHFAFKEIAWWILSSYEN
jgi:hypothetical protein